MRIDFEPFFFLDSFKRQKDSSLTSHSRSQMDNETNMNSGITHVSAPTQGNVHMAQQSRSQLTPHTRFLVHVPLRVNEYVLNLNARSFDESCAMMRFSPNFREANYSNLDMIEKY